MKYFKTEASQSAEKYEITPEEYFRVTHRKHPFEQLNETRGLSQYGVCPSCLNTVQLIGVVHKTKCRPYGKHTGKSIDGFQVWNERKYEYCPFSKKSKYREPNDEELLVEIDDNVIELYDLLKNQFDRVIYFLGKELGIKCSKVFWKRVLNQYLVNKSYCYPWLTGSNLPYIFAYWGMCHHNLYKQSFLEGSELYEVLKSYPGVKFVKSGERYHQLENKEGMFLKLHFRLVGHNQNVSEDGELRETMLFCVDDRKTGETIFEKKIEFNETYFLNIINSKESDKRQQWLLDMAADMMKPLI